MLCHQFVCMLYVPDTGVKREGEGRGEEEKEEGVKREEEGRGKG